MKTLGKIFFFPINKHSRVTSSSTDRLIYWGHTHTHTHIHTFLCFCTKGGLNYVTEGQNQCPGLFTEWIIIPSVSLYCMYYPTEQTVSGLLVLLADRAASAGL